jgi:hypothetical protein
MIQSLPHAGKWMPLPASARLERDEFRLVKGERHCEEPEGRRSNPEPSARDSGLLRFARDDEGIDSTSILPTLKLRRAKIPPVEASAKTGRGA